MKKFKQIFASVVMTFLLTSIIIPSNRALAMVVTGITGSSGNAAYLLSSTVVVDSGLTVTGGTITGSNIMIDNYKTGDQLSYTATLPSGVSGSFSTTTGILTFTGSATAAQWQEILRTVTFTTTSSVKDTRTVTFTLGSAVAFNGHYYQYYNYFTTWEIAKTDAQGYSYFGLHGYLATITSAEENEFIFKNLVYNGWIGATDDSTYTSGVEGDWYWVTGPEAGTLFSQGNDTPQSYQERYMNWNTNEPNNDDTDEHYGMIDKTTGKWNDMSSFIVVGYVVEYGGMSGDPTVHLSTQKNIEFTYSITYNLDGGTNYTEAPTTYTALTSTITLGTPTKTNYKFIGWYDAQTDGNKVTQIVNGSTGNKTLYARWLETPDAPELKIKTATKIELKYVDADHEYRVNGGAWQSSTVFESLSADTAYTFETRIKAKGIDPASNVSNSTVIKTNKLVLSDTSKGNSITAVGDTSFDPDTELIITQVNDYKTDNSSANKVNIAIAGQDKTIAELYDVKLMLENQVIQPNGTIRIKIKLSDELKADASKLQIFYIKDNGEYEKIPSTIEGDYIVFEVDHLSQYAIISPKSSTIPVTGESTAYNFIVFGIGLIAAAGLILLFQKKYTKKQDK